MAQGPDLRLSPWMKAGWAAGDVGIACYVGGTMMYLLFFLTEAHGLSPAWAGLALLVPRIVDVLTDPLMGAISDRTSSRFGRRRIYLLVGALLFGATFYLTFAMPAYDEQAPALLHATLLYLFTGLAYTVYSIPHAAMAAEMSADYRERTSIVGYRMMGSRIGILGVVLLGPWLFSSQATLREGFHVFGAVFGALILAGGLVSFYATRSAPRLPKAVASLDFRRELSALLGNRPFRILFSAFFLQNIAIGMSATTLVYFLTVAMDVQLQHVGWFAAGTAGVAMLATPVWMRAGGKWGMEKTRMYRIAIVMQVTVYVSMFALAQPGALVLFIALLALLGIGDAGCQLAPHSMVPDTVEADELRTGIRREGTIFGALSGGLKLGMALGAFMASAMLGLFGFVPGQAGQVQAELAGTGVRLAYCLGPASLWLMALWLLRRYQLDEAQHRAMRRQLASDLPAARGAEHLGDVAGDLPGATEVRDIPRQT